MAEHTDSSKLVKARAVVRPAPSSARRHENVTAGCARGSTSIVVGGDQFAGTNTKGREISRLEHVASHPV
jgi:hypothetical protein